MLKLRFRESELPRLASRYPVAADGGIETWTARAGKRGHLERDEFLRICEWKTPRSRQNCRKNSASLVEEATRVAFAAKNEEIKIGALRILSGVEWPTASVILHLCDRGPYPILDVRALWSLGFARPPVYTFWLWWDYTRFARELSRRSRLTMRDVDRALWQYSKERQ
jgi:hypothetical protein